MHERATVLQIPHSFLRNTHACINQSTHRIPYNIYIHMYSKVSAVSVSVGRTTPLLIHRVRRSPKRVRGHITRGLLRGLCSSVLGWPNHLCLAAFLEYLTEVGLGATISASTSTFICTI